MIKIEPFENEAIDATLARFKRAVAYSGVLDECRKRQFFVKKSLARKAKSKLAAAKRRKSRRSW